MSHIRPLTGIAGRAATAARYLKKLGFAVILVVASILLHDAIKPFIEMALSRCGELRPAIIMFAAIFVLRSKSL